MNSKTIRAVTLMASALVGAVTLTACGSSSAATGIKAGEVTQEGDQLIAAAAKEKELSFYCGAAPATCEAMANGFMAKYGDVKVTVLRATSADLSARYSSEKKSRAKTADVILHSDLPFIAVGLKEGLVTSFKDVGYLAKDFPKEWLVQSDEISGTPFISEAMGIGVNTNLVPEGDRPKTWSDLTDPKWKGKMNGPDKTNAGFAPIYGTTSDHVDGLIKGLSKQEIFGDSGGMLSLTESLGAGQYALQSLASPVMVAEAKKKGAPVEIVMPEPGSTGPAFAYTLNPEPAHPSAQKLFAQYVTSPEGSKQLSPISGALAAAYLHLDFNYFPPNFEYYTEAGKKKIVDAMSGK